MKRNGFTLVELLGVIVILAIITLIAVPNVTGLLRREKEQTLKVVKENLDDAALTYAKEQVDLGNIKLNRCATNVEVSNSNYTTYSTGSNKCATKVKVSVLLNGGYFDDDNSYCNKDKEIIIYKYYNGNYDEVKVNVPDDTCSID